MTSSGRLFLRRPKRSADIAELRNGRRTKCAAQLARDQRLRFTNIKGEGSRNDMEGIRSEGKEKKEKEKYHIYKSPNGDRNYRYTALLLSEHAE